MFFCRHPTTQRPPSQSPTLKTTMQSSMMDTSAAFCASVGCVRSAHAVVGLWLSRTPPPSPSHVSLTLAPRVDAGRLGKDGFLELGLGVHGGPGETKEGQGVDCRCARARLCWPRPPTPKPGASGAPCLPHTQTHTHTHQVSPLGRVILDRDALAVGVQQQQCLDDRHRADGGGGRVGARGGHGDGDAWTVRV